MGLFDGLFKGRKRPGRGGVPEDEDTDPSSYTRVIAREPEPARRPESGGWDDEPPPHELPPLRDEVARTPGRYEAPPASPARTPSAALPRPQAPAEANDEKTVLGTPQQLAPTKIVAVLVCVDGPIEGHVVRLYQGENVIGRRGQPESERLPEAARTISREHVRVTAEDGYFMIQPIRAENATCVNDVPVDGHESLSNGDRVMLGATKPSTFVLLVVPS